MEDGQTFVIGGLIQHTVNGTTHKIPCLGDLPFVGTLFSSKSYDEEESELVVMVTPHLVDPMSCDQLPKVLPGQETRSPDNFELFLEGILEAPHGARCVFPNGHYEPAYKNGPSASVFPCGMDACGTDSGRCCGKGSCSRCGSCPAECGTPCSPGTLPPAQGTALPPAVPPPAGAGRR
jgi:pilus assembly protein CpaC